MSNYNPFAKPFDKIGARDLALLKNVEEGWYIEYKSIAKSAKDIAKSISSFANTYGGFVIYGVEENNDNPKLPGGFLGVDLSEIYDWEELIKNAVKDHINPNPFFKTRIIKGPNKDIGLSEDKAIIVVQIPESYDTPHIHRTRGKVYIRVNDSSEPKPLKERHLLDDLYSRNKIGKKIVRYKSKFIYDFDQEDKAFCIQINFFVDPYGVKKIQHSFNIEYYQELIKEIIPKKMGNLGLPYITFDNVHSYPNLGLCSRHIHKNEPINYTFAFLLNLDLSANFFIPLNIYQFGNQAHQDSFFSLNFKHKRNFYQLIKEQKVNSANIINFHQALLILLSSFYHYFYILDELSYKDVIYYNVKIRNANNIVLYVDSQEYLDYLESNKIPFIKKKLIEVPDKSITMRPGKGLLKTESVSICKGDESKNLIKFTVLIFRLLLDSLGIPEALARMMVESETFIRDLNITNE